MQTDGKGETQPVDKNNTVTGKANNRRVEFIKL
jgi:flagellar motor protein MotB